jgi:hypothetical protein
LGLPTRMPYKVLPWVGRSCKWVFATCPLLVLSGMALAQPRAHDQTPGPPAVALEWENDDAAAHCLDRDAFMQAVDAVARRPVFSAPSHGGVVLRVQVGRALTGYRARLTLETTDHEVVGTRDLAGEATACDELSRAVALAAVLTIESLSAVASPPPPRSPPPERTTKSPWLVEITPLAILSWGRIPSPAPGLGMGAAVLPHPMWSTEASVYAWLSQRAGEQPPTATISGWGAALSECIRIAVFVRAQSRLCVGGEVNQTRGEAVGLLAPQSRVSTWSGLRATTGVSAFLGHHVSLRLDLDASAPLARDDFYYLTSRGAEVVIFKPAAVDLDVALGVVFAFP